MGWNDSPTMGWNDSNNGMERLQQWDEMTRMTKQMDGWMDGDCSRRSRNMFPPPTSYRTLFPPPFQCCVFYFALYSSPFFFLHTRFRLPLFYLFLLLYRWHLILAKHFRVASLLTKGVIVTIICCRALA